MTPSNAASELGLELYQEFRLRGHEGTLRFTETMLELKAGNKWGPAYIQGLLIKAIIEKTQKDNGFLILV